jgi:hypothetical protein
MADNVVDGVVACMLPLNRQETPGFAKSINVTP